MSIPLIYGIDHVQLAMPAGREAEARDFYHGVLGLREVPKPPVLAGRGGVWFESGAARIHLGVDADFRPALKAHPALLVHDLDAVVLLCLAAGHDTHGDEPVEGFNRVHVFDPFGNRIELLQRVRA